MSAWPTSRSAWPSFTHIHPKRSRIEPQFHEFRQEHKRRGTSPKLEIRCAHVVDLPRDDQEILQHVLAHETHKKFNSNRSQTRRTEKPPPKILQNSRKRKTGETQGFDKNEPWIASNLRFTARNLAGLPPIILPLLMELAKKGNHSLISPLPLLSTT
jgi:hypothetical protein